MAKALQDGGYDFTKTKAIAEEQAARGVEAFPEMMDEQLEKITAFLHTLTEEDLMKEYDLFGM